MSSPIGYPQGDSLKAASSGSGADAQVGQNLIDQVGGYSPVASKRDPLTGGSMFYVGSGGYYADAPAKRVAVCGHSVPAQSFNYANPGYGGLSNDKGYASYGWVSFWIYLTGYAGPIENYSVAATSTAELAAQVAAAVAYGADTILLHNGGINDGAFSASESIDNIKAALKIALGSGLRVVIATEASTETFTSSAERIETINAFIRSVPSLAPMHVRVADFARISSSPSALDGSSYLTVLDDTTYDTAHPNQMAAYLFGKEAVRATGNWVQRGQLNWNNGTNYLTNGRLGGTAGTVTSGLANSNAPDGWISDRHGAATVTFATYVARTLAIRYPFPLTSGGAAVAIPKGLRVRPTTRNGYHYVALTAGNVAYIDSEPTGGTLWGTVTASSITWLVVPENDSVTHPEIGSSVLMDYKTTTAGASDYVRMYQEVAVSGMASTVGIQGAMTVIPTDGYCGDACLRVSFLDSGNAIIGNTWGMAPQIMASSASSPYYTPWSRDGGLVLTPPMNAPAGTVTVRFSVQMFGMGGGTNSIPCRIGVSDCVLRNGEI